MQKPVDGALQVSYFDDFLTDLDRTDKTTGTYKRNLRQFVAWLRYTGTTNPTREDILSYRDYLIQEHPAIRIDDSAPGGWTYRTDREGNRITGACSAATTAQYMRSLRQFFQWAADAGYYPDIAGGVRIQRIRRDRHKKDALEASDVLAIEKSIEKNTAERIRTAGKATKDKKGRTERAAEQGKRTLAMYTLAVNMGLRTVEISRANVRDLEVTGGKAYLWIHGKGHTEPDERKPIAPEVYAILRDYLDARGNITGNSPLFTSTGNRSKGKRIATTTISRILKQAMKQAGFDSARITAHSLRHTAGTAVMEMTGNIYATQRYMRHADPRTTEIYLHNSTEKQEEETARALYLYYHGQIPSKESCFSDSIKKG